MHTQSFQLRLVVATLRPETDLGTHSCSLLLLQSGLGRFRELQLRLVVAPVTQHKGLCLIILAGHDVAHTQVGYTAYHTVPC